MTVTRAGQNSFIQYVGLEPAQAQQTPVRGTPNAVTGTPDAFELTTRAGTHLQQVADRATANAAIGPSELKVLLDKIGNLATTAELRDAYTVVGQALDKALVPHESRQKLVGALTERALAIPGGQEVIPMFVTQAVGEDIFGMGALPLSPVAAKVYNAALNQIITRTEVNGIAAALAQTNDVWELHNAFSALRFGVTGNAISRDDRATLARAYNDAAQRIGDGFMPVTRGLYEDVFGAQPRSIASDMVAKATRDGAFQPGEVNLLAHNIEQITGKEELAQVFLTCQRLIGRVDEGAPVISPRDRTKLAHAFFETNRALGGDALPVAATRRVGEDAFGDGAVTQTAVEKTLTSVVADEAISKQNTDALLRDLAKIQTKESFGVAYSAIRQAVSLNLITREDRQRLVEGVLDRSQALESHLVQTRAMNEDVLGFWPDV